MLLLGHKLYTITAIAHFSIVLARLQQRFRCPLHVACIPAIPLSGVSSSHCLTCVLA